MKKNIYFMNDYIKYESLNGSNSFCTHKNRAKLLEKNGKYYINGTEVSHETFERVEKQIAVPV